MAPTNAAAADAMLHAAWESGRAIALTRTTAAHAMSYQITKRLGLAHAHACMLTLPILWEDEPDFEYARRLSTEFLHSRGLS